MNGEYVKFSDADDVMYLDAIEKLVNRAKHINNKKCILFGNLDLMNESGEIIKKFKFDDCNNMSKKEINSRLLNHQYIAPTSSLLHRSIFEYGIFNKDIRLNEDYDLWLRLCILHGCTIHLLPEPILKGRKHHKSLTVTNARKAKKQDNMIRDNILNQLERHQRDYYTQELKKLKRNISMRGRFRQAYQNTMYSILGTTWTEKILNKYSMIRYNRPFIIWQ